MQIEIPVTSAPAFFNGIDGKKMLSFYAKCKDIIGHDINKAPNLREANVTQKQTILLINSLEEEPETFAYKCDALAITAKNATYKDDKVVLEFPDKADETYGLINGGHRLLAMEYLDSFDRLSEEAYIHVEVIYGNLKGKFVNPIVIARNNTMRTRKNDVYNKEGKFDVLKDIFAGQPFADDVAYYSGTDKFMDPQYVASIIMAFSRCRLTFHPVLGEVMESRYISGNKCNNGAAVNSINLIADEIRKNKEFFNSVIYLARRMDDLITAFAEKYPNNRLDLKKVRFPFARMSKDENLELALRPSLVKVMPFIFALNQLVTYDEATGKYGFVEYADDFLTESYVREFIKKVITSKELFKDKNFRKDTFNYGVQYFRDSDRFHREAARIIRMDYAAFAVKKAAEEKAIGMAS